MSLRLLILPFLAALVIYLNTACGTLTNLDRRSETPPPRIEFHQVPLGGVGNSLVTGALDQVDAFKSTREGKIFYGLLVSGIGWYNWLIDVPLSAGGDALTLPVVIWQLWHTEPPSECPWTPASDEKAPAQSSPDAVQTPPLTLPTWETLATPPIPYNKTSNSTDR